MEVNDDGMIFRFNKLQSQDADFTCEEVGRKGRRQEEIRTVVAAKDVPKEARKQDIRKQ